MTSINKKKKCTRTLLDRGGEKGKIFRWKHFAMFHKKERTANKKECTSKDRLYEERSVS